MPFVQVMISLGSVSASASAATTPTTANAVVDVLGEAPPADTVVEGESACVVVDDVPMSPTLLASVARLGTVPVAVGSSASASGSVNAVVIGNTNEPPPVYGVVGGIVGNQIEAQWSDYARTSPTSTSADASTTIASIPPTFASAATTATPAYIVEDQPSEVPPAAVVVDDESARSQVEDVPMPFVQARISLGSTSASVSASWYSD